MHWIFFIVKLSARMRFRILSAPTTRTATFLLNAAEDVGSREIYDALLTDSRFLKELRNSVSPITTMFCSTHFTCFLVSV